MILTFSTTQKRGLYSVYEKNTWVHSFQGALDSPGRNKEESLEKKMPTYSLFH